MLLNFAPVNTPLVLKSIKGGKDIRKRLTELGLIDGCEFEVVQSSGSGPVMIRIHGSKIAIGKGMAHRIDIDVK